MSAGSSTCRIRVPRGNAVVRGPHDAPGCSQGKQFVMRWCHMPGRVGPNWAPLRRHPS